MMSLLFVSLKNTIGIELLDFLIVYLISLSKTNLWRKYFNISQIIWTLFTETNQKTHFINSKQN